MKRILFFMVFLLASGSIFAQETYTSSGRRIENYQSKKKREERFVDRLVVGGSVGLGFGTVTNISFAPKVGYKITDNWAAGVSLGYQYYRLSDYYLNYAAKSNIFTTGIWTRYVIWKGLFAHAELQQNFMSEKRPDFDPSGSGNIVYLKDNYNATSLLVGPGYRQWAGEHISFNISVVYDVLQQPYNPYGNQLTPIIDIMWHF